MKRLFTAFEQTIALPRPTCRALPPIGSRIFGNSYANSRGDPSKVTVPWVNRHFRSLLRPHYQYLHEWQSDHSEANQPHSASRCMSALALKTPPHVRRRSKLHTWPKWAWAPVTVQRSCEIHYDLMEDQAVISRSENQKPRGGVGEQHGRQ